MAVTASIHTLQDYLDQAAPVLLEIPGLSQLMRADGNSYDVLAGCTRMQRLRWWS